jgi:hypothetical protein
MKEYEKRPREELGLRTVQGSRLYDVRSIYTRVRSLELRFIETIALLKQSALERAGCMLIHRKIIGLRRQRIVYLKHSILRDKR